MNYRRFRDASVELGDGVIGILGQNGTGKSSLVEAVAWAVYGNESGILRNGKEGVKRSGATLNEECQVTVEFDLEGDAYRLVRSIRGKNSMSDAALFVNEKPLAKGDRAVTEEMIKRLGMDHKAFFISVFARQKDLNSLSVLRPAERKKLILRMLGIDVLDDVVDNISKDANTTRSTLDTLSSLLVNEDGREKENVLREERDRLIQERAGISAQLDISKEHIAALECEVAKAKEDMERSETRSARHRTLEAARVGLESDIRNMTARKQRTAADLASLDEKARSLESYGGVEAELVSLEKRKDLLDDLKARHSQVASLEQMMALKNGQVPGLTAEVEKAEADMRSLGDPEQTVQMTEEAIEVYRTAEASAKEDAKWCSGEIERLRKEIAEKEARAKDILTLGPDSECPTCERRLGDQHSLLLGKISREIDGLNASVGTLDEKKMKAEEAGRKALERKGRIEEKRRDALKAMERKNELQRKISAAKAALESVTEDVARATKQISLLGRIDYDPAAHEEVRRKMAELRPKADQVIRLRSDLQRRPALEAEGKEIDAKLHSSTDSLAATELELKMLQFRADELSEGRKAYSKARDDKDEELRKVSSMRSEVSKIDGSIDTMGARIAELSEESRRAAELKGKLMELGVLLNAMKDFRSNVMSRVVPTLSRSASELFTELTEGRFGGMELDEDYEVHIYDGGESYPLTRFSGGEADLANLSLRLAISQMIAERSGRHVNLLVLDEIFGSQDNVRKRNILNLLATLQRQFSQIIVITHIDDIKDSVDDLIVISETGDGCSRIGRVG